VGDEVCGKEGYVRPVVVIHRFGSVCLIAPLTTKWKDDMWHQQISATVVVPISRIKLTNMTTISIKRFIRKIDVLEETEFMQTLSRISALTGIQS
jgi:mRNA-degrading endonuclease toxin of MazEF toxin-antitoxin module